MTITEEVIRMNKTNLINAMHDVLLGYGITTLRTLKEVQAGHKDDFGTAFDYGIYFGAERMAVTVLEHIYGQQETRKFLDKIYEEARRQVEDED